MTIEFTLWVLLPMLLTPIVAAVSAGCAWKVPSAAHRLACLVVLTAVAWSEIVLFAMARGAWPTFLPHILIVIVFIIAAVQVIQAASGAD